MRRILVLMGIGAALLTAGCGDDEGTVPTGSDNKANPPGTSPGTPGPDTVQDLATEFIKQLDQLGQALRGVRDTASAEKVAEITPLACAQFRSIAQRLQKLEVPSDTVKKAINEEVEAREEELARSLGSQEDFLSTLDPSARQIVEKAMTEFIQTMEEINPVMEQYFLEKEESPVAPPPPPPQPGPAPANPEPGEPAPVPAPEVPPVPSEGAIDPPSEAPAPTPAPAPDPE